MFETGLLLFYIVIFFLLCLLLSAAARQKSIKLWSVLFLLELLATLGSVGALLLFDRLPGSGMMPGLFWLAEFLFSMGAAVLYALLLIFSLLFFLFSRKDRKRK